MEFHPIAELFPLMTDKEIAELATDITENGLLYPVVTFEDKILDGRNRYLACGIAGVNVRYREYPGDSPLQFVVSLNLKRRHLNESQRAMIAARMANEQRGGDRVSNAKRPHGLLVSQPEAAKLLNVSERSVRRAKKLQREAPELVPGVEAGHVTVTEALRKTPHVAQNTGNSEWYTPREYIVAAVNVMDNIDLDPASTELANTVVMANRFYTAHDDGLSLPWKGRIWLNPPYSADLVGKFVDKLIREQVEQAIVLVNNATETVWFGKLVATASAIVFPLGRVKFWGPNNKVACPLQGQAVLYRGSYQARFLQEFGRFGWGCDV